MSMFSGIGSQISGFVAQKMGKNEGAPGEPGAEPTEAVAGGEMPQENGGVEGQPGQPGFAGSAMGFAQGLMAKAAAAKDGIKEKAGTLGAGNLQSMAGGVMSQVQGIIPGMRRGEEEVPEPAPQQEGEYQEYQEGGYQEYQDDGTYAE